MLKNLPFELLACCIEDLGNKAPGLVVVQDDLAMSIRSFQPNNLIYTIHLGPNASLKGQKTPLSKRATCSIILQNFGTLWT